MKRNYGVAGRLKAALKASKFKNAKEFCEKYSIPYFTFAQHAQGRRMPKSKTLALYSKALDINLAWLETGVGHPYSNQEQNITLSDELNKSEVAENSRINIELLTLILVETNRLRRNKNWSLKKEAQVAAELYNEINLTSQDRQIQKKLLNAFLKVL